MDLNIGICGAGAAGRLHAAAVAATPGMRVAAVADTDELAARDLALQYQTHSHRTAQALIDYAGLDAVIVATPSSTHIELGHAALTAGKHVLIEKPVGRTSAEVLALAGHASQAGLVAVPGHNYVHHPECARLIRHARQDLLGSIRSLHVHYAISHSEELASHYSGVLDEVLVHHAYIALSVLGPPDVVHGGRTASAWEHLPSDDQAWMVWEYSNGTVALMYATFAVDDLSAHPWTFSVKALGSEGTAAFDWRATTTKGGPFAFGIPLYEETYAHQAAAFRDVIQSCHPPLSTLEDAAAVADVINRLTR